MSEMQTQLEKNQHKNSTCYIITALHNPIVWVSKKRVWHWQHLK